MGRYTTQIKKWDDRTRKEETFTYTYPTKEAGILILTYKDVLPKPKSDKVNTQKRYYQDKYYYYIEKATDCYASLLKHKFYKDTNTWAKNPNFKLINMDVVRAENKHPSDYTNQPISRNLNHIETQIFYHYVRIYTLDYVRGGPLSKAELTTQDRQRFHEIAWSDNDYAGIIDLS